LIDGNHAAKEKIHRSPHRRAPGSVRDRARATLRRATETGKPEVLSSAGMLPFNDPIVCPSCDRRIARFVTMAGGVEGHEEEAVVEDWRCPDCGPFFLFAPRDQGWRDLYPKQPDEPADGPRH
jgi:hypothetical protein